MAKIFLMMWGVFFAMVSVSAQAYTTKQLETFENEPPVVRRLLEQASVLDAIDDIVADWQAAKLYCESSRYGSAEGLYRFQTRTF